MVLGVDPEASSPNLFHFIFLFWERVLLSHRFSRLASNLWSSCTSFSKMLWLQMCVTIYSLSDLSFVIWSLIFFFLNNSSYAKEHLDSLYVSEECIFIILYSLVLTLSKNLTFFQCWKLKPGTHTSLVSTVPLSYISSCIFILWWGFTELPRLGLIVFGYTCFSFPIS